MGMEPSASLDLPQAVPPSFSLFPGLNFNTDFFPVGTLSLCGKGNKKFASHSVRKNR